MIGSARLAQPLIGHNLADEFRLMIDPVPVGGGKGWGDATGGVEHSLTNNVWRSLRG